MTGYLLLLAGLALWTGAHLFKRLAPEARARLEARMGPAARGPIAAALLLALVAMVLGYRAAPFDPIFQPPAWGKPVNNLLMLVAVYAFGVGPSRGALAARWRHPMLTGVVLWAIAHLLANGDLASVLLFGGLGAWALVEIGLINAAGPWTPPAPGPVRRDLLNIPITLAIYAAIAGVHWLLGYNVFGMG